MNKDRGRQAKKSATRDLSRSLSQEAVAKIQGIAMVQKAKKSISGIMQRSMMSSQVSIEDGNMLVSQSQQVFDGGNE